MVCYVLNLIITGIPSIQTGTILRQQASLGFKPYYNWNAFNTKDGDKIEKLYEYYVLNLIITGMPSIPSIRCPT